MARIPLPSLGPRMRRVVRYLGLTLLALVVFVFALQMTFPFERVRDKIVDALAEKYEVTIGGVERGWVPGRVYFKAVTLRTRPTKPEETVTTFFVKQLEVDVGILSLVGGTISVDLDAQIGAGTLAGSIALDKFGKGDVHLAFTGERLPGDSLPLRAVLGLPVTGKLDFSVNLDLPVEKSKMGKPITNWQKARGTITLACASGCTIGDGKTKLKPLVKNTRQQAMVGEGIEFGKVNLDTLAAKVSIGKGKLTLDRFDTKSKDGELKIDYTMTLEKDFGESMVAGCLRFKGTEDLMKREPKTYAALTTTGAELRGDGLFHIRLTDRFKEMKRLNQECGPNTKTNNGEDFSGKSERPNLTVQPDTPGKPETDTSVPGGSAMTAPPPPPPAPVPAPTPTPSPDPGVTTDGAGSGSAPPATPPGSDPTGANPSPEPPRERAGEQAPINAAGSAESATPPPE